MMVEAIGSDREAAAEELPRADRGLVPNDDARSHEATMPMAADVAGHEDHDRRPVIDEHGRARPPAPILDPGFLHPRHDRRRDPQRDDRLVRHAPADLETALALEGGEGAPCRLVELAGTGTRIVPGALQLDLDPQDLGRGEVFDHEALGPTISVVSELDDPYCLRRRDSILGLCETRIGNESEAQCDEE
jgi:hypothetical protein